MKVNAAFLQCLFCNKYWLLCTWARLFYDRVLKQECIPVGCVMSACSSTASRGICGDWACFAEGWGVHGRGVGCGRQGVVDGRVSCVAGGYVWQGQGICGWGGTHIPQGTEWQTHIETLPCHKLRLWAVIKKLCLRRQNKYPFHNRLWSKTSHSSFFIILV